jgi:dienelactone hydrolase
VSPDTAWYHLGKTPLKDLRIPAGYFRWRLSKQGAGAYLAAPGTEDAMSFALDSVRAAPEGMVWVRGGSFFDYIDFVGWVGPYDLPPFYIDRFEVTNREYQKFVDSSGYQRRKYWDRKFVQGVRELSWEQAMALFRDGTGRAGPSTWEGGHYPDRQADYPVSGISWYEASAYASFVGKSLPTLAQWYRTAQPDIATHTVQTSNIARSTLAPVGAFKGLGPYGTYDMAGNVREWTENAIGGRRFLLGGSWKSPTYLSVNPEALSPFDRSPANGVRCLKNTASLPPAVSRPVKTLERDFSRARPASDAVFRAYRMMYAYDTTALNAKVEGVVQDSRDWREEKITFDAAYGNERVPAYLYLPKKVRPPYQTIVFFPSARVLDLTDSRTLGDTAFFDYIIQSGRAVLYPIYQNTYERRVKSMLPGASQRMQLTVQRFKDLGRSLDYLQTRADIDKDKLAYLGVSMGTAEGVIYTTLVQDRLRTVVFLDGGFFLGQALPGRDQVDFAPRLKKPVLMVNGRYDFTFSLEKSQIPLFRMLGAPSKDKRHVVLESPHDVTARRAELVQAVLGWLDQYLGRVQ